MKNKKVKISVKIVLCIFYLIVMAILFLTAFRLYRNDRKEIPWQNVTSINDYTSLEISKMSEAFAKIDKNKQIHFVIVKDEKDIYRSYLIAIDKKTYKNYKEIIDYSYNRIDKEPNKLKVLGYPRVISKELKKLTLDNYKKFLPNDNSVELTNKNFNKYITNTYLDTTIKKGSSTNYIIILFLVLILVLFILLLVTLFDKKEHKKNKKEEKIEIL